MIKSGEVCMISSRSIQINNPLGFHTRIAAMISQKADRMEKVYGARLYIGFEGRPGRVPMSSFLTLFSNPIKKGDTIRVAVEGDESEKVLDEMVEFIQSCLECDKTMQVDNLLQQASVTYERIFENVPSGIVVVDMKGIISLFNKSAEKTSKIAASTVIGRPYERVLPGWPLDEVFAGGGTYMGMKLSIGGAPVLANISPIYSTEGMIGIVSTFQDMREIDNLSSELDSVKEMEKRYHSMLEAVHDGICLVDSSGVIAYVNPAYERIVGTQAGELVGRSIYDISPDGARAGVLKLKKPVVGMIGAKPNGVRYAEDLNPIFYKGRFLGIISVIKEITEIQELTDKLSEEKARAEYLEDELKRSQQLDKAFNIIIGKNGKLMDALSVASKAASTDVTVLIRGDSGTGKELVARAVHFASKRKDKPFIRVNCAAIPSNLLESELFGYEKGAFTGAANQKPGRFELADGGTIFLDEIGDLPPDMQVKILRVIEDKEFERVGGITTIRVNARIVAATNRNLEEMMKEGSFREDLYYRLNIVPVFLPPLKERRDDIPALVEHFLCKMNKKNGTDIRYVSKKALKALERYDWPGNIRELQNIIERCVIMADRDYIDTGDLPMYIVGYKPKNNELINYEGGDLATMEEYEKEIISLALKKYGSFNKAGKALGITHKTVASKARKFGIVDNNEHEMG